MKAFNSEKKKINVVRVMRGVYILYLYIIKCFIDSLLYIQKNNILFTTRTEFLIILV